MSCSVGKRIVDIDLLIQNDVLEVGSKFFSSENPHRISPKHQINLVFCDSPVPQKRQKAFKQMNIAKTAVLPELLLFAQIH